MGEISYSLYLVHVYVFIVLQRVLIRIPMGHETFRVVLFVARPVAALICAWATFRYVEAPLSTWARELLLRIRLPFWLGIRPLIAK